MANAKTMTRSTNSFFCHDEGNPTTAPLLEKEVVIAKVVVIELVVTEPGFPTNHETTV